MERTRPRSLRRRRRRAMPGPAVDGATLREWRLSRGWDVSRLAREFIKAADEPLATVRGLMHMINAWERGARRPSERHWLLYLRLFSERATGEAANGGPEEAGALARAGRRGAGELPGIVESKAIEAAALGSPSPDPGGSPAPGPAGGGAGEAKPRAPA